MDTDKSDVALPLFIWVPHLWLKFFVSDSGSGGAERVAKKQRNKEAEKTGKQPNARKDRMNAEPRSTRKIKYREGMRARQWAFTPPYLLPVMPFGSAFLRGRISRR
jgi:hypothetical protein